jgi:16S rRNA (uracil1498-N3)-methyltransferase
LDNSHQRIAQYDATKPMTRRRWIADEFSSTHAALTGEHAAHLVRVLRARVGQDFDIATGGSIRRGRIISIAPDRVEFELAEEISAPSVINVTLFLSIFKFDRMEWAIEKCTELGIARFVPVIAYRTDTHLASAAEKRVERWRRIAAQAAEQSRRTGPPEIAAPRKLQQAISSQGELRILLSESERQRQIRVAIKGTARDVLLAIGPEGGWTEGELQLFQQADWISASLGSTILRAETAAIAATAIVITTLSG